MFALERALKPSELAALDKAFARVREGGPKQREEQALIERLGARTEKVRG